MAKQARILIVEDEAIVAEDLEMTVTNIGYEVVGRAASADEAVKMAVLLKPDLILMDIVMIGRKNGIDASHEIKEKTDIPVIFLTAYTDIGLIDKAKSTEPYAYLVKPFQERQLFASIEMGLYKCRAERHLKASERKYKHLYSMVRLMCDNLPDLIWTKDLEGKFIFTNKACCEKLLNAKDTDEPIGKTEFYFGNREKESHPENPDYHTFGERCADTDLAVLESKRPQKFDEFGNVKGEFLYLDVYKAPFWDEKGDMIGTVGCAKIVTKEKQLEEKHKRAEEALRENEEKYRTLVETMDEGMVIADENENLTFVNRAASTIFGYSKEELLGKNLSELTTPEDFQRVVDQTAIRKTGKSSQYELTIIRKDGEPRITVVTSTPMKDSNGIYQGSFGVFRDIAERKQAEKALRKSEKLYHLLADNMIDGVWQLNLDFEFTYVNPAIMQMLGFTQEEWIGSSLFDHCSTEDMEIILNVARDVLNKGPESSGETFEMQMLHKNGESIDVEIRTKLLFDDDGNPIGTQGAARDITERIRAEEQVKMAYRLREHFLKEASHRIITPVAIIGGYTDLLEESADPNDQQKEYIRIIRERNEEIQELVTDSLAGKYLKEYVE